MLSHDCWASTYSLLCFLRVTFQQQVYQGYGNLTLDSAVRLRPQHDTGFPEGRIPLPQFHPAGLQGAADPQGCIPDERGTDLPQALPGGLDLPYGCEPLRIVRGRLGRQLSGAVRVVVLQPPTHPPNPRVGRADTLWSEFAASSWSCTGWPTGTGGVHVGLLKDVVECAGLRPWFRDALTPGDVAVSTPHQCRLRVTLPTTIYPARN